MAHPDPDVSAFLAGLPGNYTDNGRAAYTVVAH
jgi:hypothetical protein